MISCNKDDSKITNAITVDVVTTVELPKRYGPRPETTMGVPHIQIGVELVSEVNEELFQRVYSLPGVENQPSVITGWRALWLADDIAIVKSNAIIGGREFAHIHDDGSLHIFLKTDRSYQAVESCWAVFHPYTEQNLVGYNGFGVCIRF